MAEQDSRYAEFSSDVETPQAPLQQKQSVSTRPKWVNEGLHLFDTKIDQICISEKLGKLSQIPT